MNNNLLISIVITSFNSERFIADAINSCLSTNYQNLEIIVIDGLSQDNTVNILKSFGSSINYISEADSGETEALNKGLRLANGEVIVFLNSDDLLTPNSLLDAASIFSMDPEIEFVFGNAAYCDENGKIFGQVKNLSILSYEYLLNKNPDLVSQPAGFFSRKLLLKIGGWNPHVNFVNDLELWLRVLRNTKCKHFNSLACIVRRHSMQQSVKYNKQLHIESVRIRKRMGGKLLCKANINILKFYTYSKFKKIIKNIFYTK